jgi:lipoprotein signal peptidase
VSKKDFFWKLGYLLAAGAVFMIDQMTKAWAVRRLRFGDDIQVIPGFLNFAYAQNTGVAFSMLDDHGDAGFIFFLENAAFGRPRFGRARASSSGHCRQCYRPRAARFCR